MGTLDYQNSDNARRENRGRLRLKLFGPSRDDVWKALAAEIGGQFVDGGFWKGNRVVARVEPWEITLDLMSDGDSSFTRLRAPYVNPENFRFTVYRSNVFADILKKFGYQDVVVGHREFDEEFIIRGNSETRLRQLFANEQIRTLLSRQQHVKFEVRDDDGSFFKTFPRNVDQLRFMVPGTVKDIIRLKQLFDLFAETLHMLCHIGSAYEDDPGIRL